MPRLTRLITRRNTSQLQTVAIINHKNQEVKEGMQSIPLLFLLLLSVTTTTAFNGAFFFPKLKASVLQKSLQRSFQFQQNNKPSFKEKNEEKDPSPNAYLTSLSASSSDNSNNNSSKKQQQPKDKANNSPFNSYLDTVEHPSIGYRIRRKWHYFRNMDRKSMAKLGTNTVLAYLFISNAAGCICFSMAWYLACQKVRVL